MSSLHVDDLVRVLGDVPECSLHRGDRGVVRSIWFSPNDQYEVEFEQRNAEYGRRCILPSRQLEVDEEVTDGRR